jgi:hypothetical protein
MTMKPMSAIEIERWARVRERGRQRFIAVETITLALIPVVAVVLVYSFEYFRNGKLDFSSIDYLRDFFLPVVFALYGFFKAHFSWTKQEDRFRASQNR